MDRIFFTADLHFGDKGALRYLKDRPYATDNTTYAHDRWLYDLWCRTVQPGDTVYILGDVCAYAKPRARELVESLPGKKVLIWGNHDAVMQDCRDCFSTCGQLFDKKLKVVPAQGESMAIRLAMCHYPMLTWKAKPKGAVMLHGHSHGRLDAVNAACPDLRWDIGLDGALSRAAGNSNGSGFGLVSLTALSLAVFAKAGMDLKLFAKQAYGNGQAPELFSALSCSRADCKWD